MLKLFPVAGIDDIKHDVKHLYVLKQLYREGFLKKGELSICDNIEDAEVKTLTPDEAQNWKYDVNSLCDENDNADSRAGKRHDFYEFSLMKLT